MPSYIILNLNVIHYSVIHYSYPYFIIFFAKININFVIHLIDKYAGLLYDRNIEYMFVFG